MFRYILIIALLITPILMYHKVVEPLPEAPAALTLSLPAASYRERLIMPSDDPFRGGAPYAEVHVPMALSDVPPSAWCDDAWQTGGGSVFWLICTWRDDTRSIYVQAKVAYTLPPTHIHKAFKYTLELTTGSLETQVDRTHRLGDKILIVCFALICWLIAINLMLDVHQKRRKEMV